MAEKTTIMIPSKENFELSKVKRMKNNGGLDIHFQVTEVIGSETYINKYHVESAKDIHPDLRHLFDDLRPILGRVFGYTSFLSMIECKDFKATANQKQTARDYADEVLKNLEVRGVSLSGKDDNLGVVLTGLYTVSNNQKTCINTPRMKFDSESFGFEEELEELVSSMEEEVYSFLFEGKKAQLDLFGDDDSISVERVEGEETELDDSDDE